MKRRELFSGQSTQTYPVISQKLNEHRALDSEELVQLMQYFNIPESGKWVMAVNPHTNPDYRLLKSLSDNSYFRILVSYPESVVFQSIPDRWIVY